MRGGLFFIEKAGIEEGCQGNLAEVRLHLTRIRIERRNCPADLRADLFAHVRDLVDHDDIGELDLVDQQVYERAPVLTVALQAAVGSVSFAGEYADPDYTGLMEGALRSGVRAADEVLARLRSR